MFVASDIWRAISVSSNKYYTQGQMRKKKSFSFLPHNRHVKYSYFTHWSRVLNEKPAVIYLVYKFPVFYGIRRFITVFTSNRPLVANLNVNTIYILKSYVLRSVLILSFNLRLVYRNGLCFSGFPTKITCVFSSLLCVLQYSCVEIITIVTTHFSRKSYQCNISLAADMLY
jgi:hypothetical protein